MITLNYRDAAPIYEQIRDGFRKLIVSGALRKGDKMPSVRSLAGELAINPNTIQRAYNELEVEGFIYSVPGKGSFVSDVPQADEKKKQEALEKLAKVCRQLTLMGVSKEEILSFAEKEVTNND